MSNKIKRLTAFALVCALLLSLAGCRSSGDDTSSAFQYVIEEEIVYVDGDGTSTDNSSTDNSSTVLDNSGVNSTPSKDDNIAIAPPYTPNKIDKCRGTTVKFAVTSDPMQSEKAYVINNFEKEFGIKIEPVILASGDQVAELASLIAAGNSPDVVRSSGDFPLSLTYLQSLDAAELDYNNPIWEQGMFELTTINGSPYLCTTQGNVYAETDIVIYRKDILKSAGCKTPEEYDAEGNWNIDAFFEIARQCVKKVSGVKGCAFVNYDSALHMTGNSVFKLENEKFVNGLGSSLNSMLTKISAARNEGIVTLDSANGIANGTIAIATSHSYALRKTGAFENKSEVWSKLGYYYLPSVDDSNKNLKTGLLRGWGLIENAPNPIAAGIFLEYYLNPNNCDIKNMYISTDAETFFFKATSIDYNNWNPYFTYGNKLSGICEIDFNEDVYKILGLSQTQIEVQLPSLHSKIDDACENLNYFVAQETYKK